MKTFPKNIRQIGEPGAGRKILIEDYVYTYLRQLAEDDLTLHEDSNSCGISGNRSALYPGGI